MTESRRQMISNHFLQLNMQISSLDLMETIVEQFIPCTRHNKYVLWYSSISPEGYVPILALGEV